MQQHLRGGLQVGGCLLDVLCRVNRADDRDAADAAARELRDIFLRDAADGDDGDGHGPADGLERLIAHIVGVILRAGREHCADAEVIRAVLFGQNGLLHGLGGDAQNLVRAENGADVQCLHIALADVDAVGVHLAGNFHVVIHKERHVAFAAKRLQFLRFFEEFFLFQRFLPQLHHRHAAVQALAHNVDEPAPVQPVAVRDGVEQQIIFIAVHTWRPHSALHRPYCR